MVSRRGRGGDDDGDPFDALERIGNGFGTADPEAEPDAPDDDAAGDGPDSAAEGDSGADFRPWTCEICGEANEVFVEPDAGALQELTEDCTVCCHPHTIRARVSRGGRVTLEVKADQ